MKLPESLRLLALVLPTLLLGACDPPASDDAADPDEDVAPEDDFEEPPEPPANWNTREQRL